MKYALILVALVSGVAWGATAYLVSSSMGTSVTGQAINICTYQYGTTQFQRIFPMGQMCPLNIEVQ